MNLNTILRGIIIALVGAAVALIPFVVANSLFFPFITGKGFVFRIMVEIAFGLWLFLAYRDPAYRPKRSPVLWAVAAFVGVITLADLFAENSAKAIWSNYERMEGLVTIAHLGMYFLVETSVFKTMKSWTRLLQASLAASVFMAGYGLLQLWGQLPIHQGSTRLDATFGNSAYLAVYMLINVFLAVFLAARAEGMFKTQARIGYGAIALLDAFILYHTETRGAILGLLGGAFVAALLIAFFGEQGSTLRRGAAGTIIAIIAIVGGFLALKDTALVRTNPVLNRFATISLTEQTTQSRFMVWNMAWQGFKERPVLGWGQEGFNYVFNTYYNPKMWSDEPWFDRAHNVFFDWLIAGGILGLGSYLALFGALLYVLWMPRAGALSVAEKSILTGLLAGYFIHNFFVFDNLMSYVLCFSLLGMVHILSTEELVPAPAKNIKRPLSNDAGLDGIVGVAAVAVIAVLIYSVNYTSYAANTTLIQALSPHQEGISKNLDAFKQALAYQPSFGTPEIREQLMQATLQVVAAPQAPMEAKQAFAELATTELEKQLAETPHDARYFTFAGDLAANLSMHDKAIGYLQKAHELSPKKQTILFELGSAYLDAQQYPQALDAFKTAFDLEPKYPDARINYATVLIYAGKIADAKSLIAAIIPAGAGAVGDLRLARAYAAAHDIGDAIAELKRIGQLDPSQKDTADSYIKQFEAGKMP